MLMDEVTLFLSVVIAGFSLLLSIVSFVAFNRLRVFKLLFIGLAFFAFFVKGLLVIGSIIDQSLTGLVIDFAVILLLYFATIKK